MALTRHFRRGATLVLVTVLAVLAAWRPPAAQADSWCRDADFVVIGARGSGQGYTPEWGWYADTVGRTVDEFKSDVSRRYLAGGRPLPVFVDRPLTNSDYPAPGSMLDFLKASLKLPAAYHQSVTKAKAGVAREFARVLAECPAKTKVLFVGYSQGAQIAADTYQQFLATNPDRIAGGIFYGDPYFRGDSAFGSSGHWPTAFNPHRHGGLGQRPEYPVAAGGRVISTCHAEDVVCQGLPAIIHLCGLREGWVGELYCAYAAVDGRTHNYTRPAKYPDGRGDNPFDLTAEAKDNAERIASRLDLPRPPVPPYSGPQDIVLVVDSTASMKEPLQKAMETVKSQFLDNPVFADARFGLVEYKGEYDKPRTRTVVPLTADKNALLAGLQSLKPNGCCIEQVLAATSMALDQPFRPEARRTIILIGDEAGDDPDAQGLSSTALAARARLIGARIIAINLNPAEIAVFGRLAKGTAGFVIGGSQTGIAGASGGHEPAAKQTAGTDVPIGEALSRGNQYPTVKVAISSPNVTGQPVIVSASDSSDPVGYIARTDWDLDNDGVFEVTGKTVLKHVYDKPGTYQIGVRVTNDIGLSSVRTISVQVVARPSGYPTRAPAAPPAPTVTAQRRALHVVVNPPTDGDPSVVYRVLDLTTGFVYAIIRADATGKPATEVTIEKLNPKKAYRIAVEPENLVGIGKTSPATTARPLGDQTVRVRRSGRRLDVSVAPRLPGAAHWTLAVELKSGSTWVTLPGQYATRGKAERASMTLDKAGTYRVAVAEQSGFPATATRPIRVR